MPPRRVASLPPGPHGRLLTGTSGYWRADTLQFMQQLVREHGPAVRFHYAFGQHAFLFAHPTHYRRILIENQRNYSKQHPLYDLVAIVAGSGLVTSDGARWLSHRRIVQPAFHHSALSAIDEIITRRTTEMLTRWDKEGTSSNGTFVEVNREMMSLTLSIVGDALFGQSLTPYAHRVGTAFSSFNEALIHVANRPLTWLLVRHRITPASRRLHAAAAALRVVVDDVIASRSAQGPVASQTDLLGLLMAARDADTGTSLTHAALRDEIMTLMIAGHETSANALTWTLHLLGSHPAVEQRVRDELYRVLGDRPATIRDLRNLPVTRAVALEAMRLYPPIYAFSRRAEQDDVVGGYHIPRGAAISLVPYVTHRMPELWDDPESFAPDRFLPPPSSRDNLAYLPFSAGARGCIGESFATTEIVLVLALLLRRYRLTPKAGHLVTPLPMLTLRPAGGLPMVRTRVA